MKNIREGFLRKNLGLGKIALIKKFLENCTNIRRWTINNDDTIDIDGDLIIFSKALEKMGFDVKNFELPEYIKFGKIKGFVALNSGGTRYKSFRGFPEYIRGNLLVSLHDDIESLEGFPKRIQGEVRIENNKKFSIKQIREVSNIKKEIYGASLE